MILDAESAFEAFYKRFRESHFKDHLYVSGMVTLVKVVDDRLVFSEAVFRSVYYRIPEVRTVFGSSLDNPELLKLTCRFELEPGYYQMYLAFSFEPDCIEIVVVDTKMLDIELG